MSDKVHENIPRSVLTLWMPVILAAMLCLFLWGQSLIAWACSLPLWIVILFMLTLAEVRQEGNTVTYRRWLGSSRADDNEVLCVGQSRLRGTAYVELKRFVLPWGRVYFQTEWANEALVRRIEPKQGRSRRSAADVVWTVIAAVSGFGTGSVVTSNVFHHTSRGDQAGVVLAMAALLLVSGLLIGRRNASLGNSFVFIAMGVAAVVRW